MGYVGNGVLALLAGITYRRDHVSVDSGSRLLSNTSVKFTTVGPRQEISANANVCTYGELGKDCRNS